MRGFSSVLAGALALCGLFAMASAETRSPGKKVVAEGIIGCSDTKSFHRASCKWTKEIEKAGTKVAFKNRGEAVKAGYKPCDDCKP